jgi:hypothetical protein
LLDLREAWKCKETTVRGNKMAEMSQGTNSNPGDVKEQLAE